VIGRLTEGRGVCHRWRSVVDGDSLFMSGVLIGSDGDSRGFPDINSGVFCCYCQYTRTHPCKGVTALIDTAVVFEVDALG